MAKTHISGRFAAGLRQFPKHCANSEHPYDQIVRHRHRDGHTIWVRCRGRILMDADGKPYRMMWSHSDVIPLIKAQSALEQMTAELSEANQLKELALSISGVGIWRWDITRNSIAWDDSMLALYNLQRRNFSDTYQEWAQRVHPDDLQGVEESTRHAVKTGQTLNTSFRILWPSG